MLTNNDLEKIKLALDPQFKKIEERFDRVDKDIANLKKSDKQIKKELSTIVNYFDRDIVDLKKRVVVVEAAIGIDIAN